MRSPRTATKSSTPAPTCVEISDFLEHGCSHLPMLDWTSAAAFPASSQPCSLQTGPHNLNWLWPVHPVTEGSGFCILSDSLDLSQV